jgi:hypothetical protein
MTFLSGLSATGKIDFKPQNNASAKLKLKAVKRLYGPQTHSNNHIKIMDKLAPNNDFVNYNNKPKARKLIPKNANQICKANITRRTHYQSVYPRHPKYD